MSATPELKNLLAACIEKSLAEDTHDFQWNAFFRQWFREKGTPCFFLFKRHLGVTNAQYVELFSLLEANCIDVATTKIKQQLLFHTTAQMKATIVDSISMLLDVPVEHRKAQTIAFAERYCELFASTVVVDMFYCSCAVFVPPTVSVDLFQVCADAGYVHSVGQSVYVRNIKKARKNDFYSNLEQHLKTVPSSELPVPFVVYAHEDFSGYDKEAREQIGRGIEHTKLYLEKMSMGGYRLAQVVHDMRKHFDERLNIPEPGPYDQVHNFEKSRTLWLICDRSVSAGNPMTPGSERYYICYEQIAKNDSPFFLL